MPDFPPLFTGTPADDPFEVACARADEGCDAGLITYDIGQTNLQAAIVFAPDVPLAEAMIMHPICGVGFQNALGALAPPEVAVHLEWAGGIRVNGASCGRLSVASATLDADSIPNWLVVGLHVNLWPETDDPGSTPDRTALFAEGCVGLDPAGLIAAWARHTLVSINTWSDKGAAAIHREWCGLVHGIDAPIEMQGKSGIFVGVDEHFGMLINDDETMHLIALTTILEPRPS
ncbi:biotin/lipoate--protein ligase family protein [Yoonia sp. 2307UL14-13]|uniref:biotin/lipoate--protein ligase family protein n=1 Tax=Yoonia sp. 2307UL14-13 TaxID=3126506 RepID=UPI0030B40656